MGPLEDSNNVNWPVAASPAASGKSSRIQEARSEKSPALDIFKPALLETDPVMDPLSPCKKTKAQAVISETARLQKARQEEADLSHARTVTRLKRLNAEVYPSLEFEANPSWVFDAEDPI